MLVPILFKDSNSSEVTGCFLNEALFKVLFSVIFKFIIWTDYSQFNLKLARCALFGKTAINSVAPVGRADSMYLPPELIIETTVGLIAWCATIVSFYILCSIFVLDLDLLLGMLHSIMGSAVQDFWRWRKNWY